ncbi:hypothetical protein N7451_009807 [Penicillium sp. IBT 35674x]|nr:hypothetical protein N7451_009807 [Penicillium sp. IBT 35674x]
MSSLLQVPEVKTMATRKHVFIFMEVILCRGSGGYRRRDHSDAFACLKLLSIGSLCFFFSTLSWDTRVENRSTEDARGVRLPGLVYWHAWGLRITTSRQPQKNTETAHLQVSLPLHPSLTFRIH